MSALQPYIQSSDGSETNAPGGEAHDPKLGHFLYWAWEQEALCASNRPVGMEDGVQNGVGLRHKCFMNTGSQVTLQESTG